MIDPDEFFNRESSGANETKFTPVPAGEYIAMIPSGGVAALREITDKEGVKKLIVDLQWEITDEEKKAEVQEITGMQNPRVKQSVFLDVITDSSGEVTGLADGKGKNIGLGRLREALGQNDPKKRWSFRHLEGSVAHIMVEHRSVGEDTYAQVARDGVVAL